jgi:ribonuclease P protein component
VIDSRFPVQNRLVDSAIFQQVFVENNKLRDRNWIILFRENDLNQARLGMAIAKKNVRKAVHRNQIKRIVRESFRIRKQALNGLDLVVLISQGINDLERKERIETLSRLLDKLSRQRESRQTTAPKTRQ